ncbi:hypothetical protein JCM8547_003283 [Rhodosporidiobolus lusitaniae]
MACLPLMTPFLAVPTGQDGVARRGNNSKAYPPVKSSAREAAGLVSKSFSSIARPLLFEHLEFCLARRIEPSHILAFARGDSKLVRQVTLWGSVPSEATPNPILDALGYLPSLQHVSLENTLKIDYRVCQFISNLPGLISVSSTEGRFFATNIAQWKALRRLDVAAVESVLPWQFCDVLAEFSLEDLVIREALDLKSAAFLALTLCSSLSLTHLTLGKIAHVLDLSHLTSLVSFTASVSASSAWQYNDSGKLVSTFTTAPPSLVHLILIVTSSDAWAWRSSSSSPFPLCTCLSSQPPFKVKTSSPSSDIRASSRVFFVKYEVEMIYLERKLAQHRPGARVWWRTSVPARLRTLIPSEHEELTE